MTEPALRNAKTDKQADDKPGFMERMRARFPLFDRIMRAQERYQDSKGDFYAAGITYFTIFALFPLLMVGFAAAGFVLAKNPELLADLVAKIKSTITGDFGEQLVGLIDSAIKSRTSVGIIGLATAAWAGLGFIGNLREALSQMWGSQRDEPPGFLRTKISDLLALLSAFIAIILTIALTALGSKSVMTTVLGWFGIHDDFPMLGFVLRAVSMSVSLLVSWLLFTWMIARLPRESVSFRSSIQAGLLAAVGFEIFKLVASIYLGTVLHGPAGATFGPVLGLMVFAYITARLVLFATAWAATSADNLREEQVAPPPPAIINARMTTRDSVGAGPMLVAAAAGVVGGVGISRLRRRQSRQD